MATMTAPQTSRSLTVRSINSRLTWGLFGVVLAAAVWQIVAARLGPLPVASLEMILPQVVLL